MTTPYLTQDSPVGMGLTSAILGSVSLVLFSLPILSIPLGGVGLVFGLIGLVLALRGGWTSFRWSVAGIALCGVAMVVSIAIAWVSIGYLPNPTVPLDTQPVPNRPYVPPPARPTFSGYPLGTNRLSSPGLPKTVGTLTVPQGRRGAASLGWGANGQCDTRTYVCLSR